MKKLLMLAGVMLLVIGCGDGGGSEYYPLTVGSTWDYRAIVTMTMYLPDTVTTVDTTTVSTEITEETTLDNGTEVVEQMTITDMGTIVDTSYSYLRDTGDELLMYSDKADTTADTAAVYPLEAGKTWIMEGDTVEVIGEESVTVPAGTWTCWHLTYGDDMDMYLAANVGLVRQTMHEEDEYYSMDMLMELTDYDVK